MTQQPIVGALVDIGVATATTNTDGQFVMLNIVVPVDAANNVTAPSYYATVNLRNVTSPVAMANAAATPRYPDFFYGVIPVTFTTFFTTTTDTTTAISTVTTSSNGTAVVGLIANVNFKVGKLASTISGVVADSVTQQPVAAGYIVKLVSLGSNNSATGGTIGTGALENIVGSTTTIAGGSFTFANIESLQNFRIDAWDAAQTFKGTVNVTAPADGQTKTLSIQENNTVFVASTDVLAPTIISVTPENNADIAASVANQNVVFTFSEPIQQNAYAKALSSSAIPTGGTGLYNHVTVSYLGAKAGNIAHTLSWNATFDQLTVNIPGLAGSSKYSVVIAPANQLVDNSNNALVLAAAGIGSGTLNFTTNGSATPNAPAITLVNSAGLDFTGTPLLDWLPISGAKAYNVYRTATIGGISGPPVLLTPQALVSTFTEAAALPFTSNQNKVTYDYIVKSVGADNQESVASNLVSAQDAVLPTIIAQAAAGSTVTLTFSEPMDEPSAETIVNYGLTRAILPAAPALSTAVYNVATNQVVLTFAAALTIDANNSLTVTNVKDISGNSNSTVGANNVRTF